MIIENAIYPFACSILFGKHNYKRTGSKLYTKPSINACCSNGYYGYHFEWNLGKYQFCIDAERYDRMSSFATYWSGYRLVLFNHGFFMHPKYNTTYGCVME